MSCLPPGAVQQPGPIMNPRNARIVGERYRLEAWLATSGRGQVWRAEDLALGRPVAVNLLSPAAEPDTEALAAIMSGYEDARARIISAPALPAGADAAEPTGALPTVPVDLRSGLPCPRPAVSDPAPTATTAPGRRRQRPVRSFLARLVTGLRSPSPASGPDHPLRWT